MNAKQIRTENGGDAPDWIDALLIEDATGAPHENDPRFVARVMEALPERHRVNVIALLSLTLSAAACALAAVFLTDHRSDLVQSATSTLGGMRLETLVTSLICYLVFFGLAALSYHLASDPDAI